MNADDLKAWRERLKLTRASAARELGASAMAYRGWEDGKTTIPRYIGLACSAVAMGAAPWHRAARSPSEPQPE
jgi:transcriptional regulator with XRE-family HTH domain